MPKALRVPVPRTPPAQHATAAAPRPCEARGAPRSTHVSHAGLDHGPVHVAGRQAGGGSSYGVSIRGLLFLLFLHRKVVRRSEMKVRAPKGKTVAEPAPTKRDAVPWGAGCAGRVPEGSAHALRHTRQCSDAAPPPPSLDWPRGTAERTDPVSFVTERPSHRGRSWAGARLTSQEPHGPAGQSGGPEARPSFHSFWNAPHRAAVKETGWQKLMRTTRTREETKPRATLMLSAELGRGGPERAEMQSDWRPGPGWGCEGGGHPSTVPLSPPYHGGRNLRSPRAREPRLCRVGEQRHPHP